MEKNQKSTFSFLLPYIIGLLLIRLLIEITVSQLNLGLSAVSISQSISALIEIGFIFLTIRNFKIFIKNGQLQFIEGIKVGVGLLLIFGIIFSIYLVIEGAYINPEFQENIAREFAELNNKEYNENADKKAIIGLFSSIIRYIVIGAVGSIISTAILKTEK